MANAIIFTNEYLTNKEFYDLYLSDSAKTIRRCIESFKYFLKNQDSRIYYINMIEFLNLTPPKELEIIHNIIANRLKNLYKEINHLELYIESKIIIRLEEKSEQLIDMVAGIIWGYYALIKTICGCKAGDMSYVDIIKKQFPEMYTFNQGAIT